MAGLPRSIIKKYGVSKKAWAVFRGTRRSRRTTTKVYTMARRGRCRRRGRIGRVGLGRVTSVKNILFTLGGAFIAPRFGISPAIGGAAGGFMGAGLAGAAVGFIGAPMVSGILGGVMGGSSSSPHLYG